MSNNTSNFSKPFTETDNTTPQFQGQSLTETEAAMLTAFRANDKDAMQKILYDVAVERWLTSTERIACLVFGYLGMSGYIDRQELSTNTWDMIEEMAAVIRDGIRSIDRMTLELVRSGQDA